MDLAIVITPKLISSELLVPILFVPQCITTDLTDFGNTILLMSHKAFSTRFPPIPRLKRNQKHYRKNKFVHTVG